MIRFDSSEKDEVLRSFNLEFTAPRCFNEIIQEIIEKRLCTGSQRVSEFKVFSREEREKMILAHGMLADVSVKVFDGLNLETLR